jgi:hypothetical protein
MATENMEDKLWTISNGITGFAILQSVAFLYAAAGKDIGIDLTSPLAMGGMAFIGIACGAIYSLAVWRAYKMALTLKVKHEQIWKEATFGRLLAITAFQLLCLFALVALPFVRSSKPPTTTPTAAKPTPSRATQ